MDKKKVALALGASVAAGVAAMSAAQADANPFGATSLDSGFTVAAAEEGRCGEGKCGGNGKPKGDEGKCGGDGKSKGAEGKCGEGKCGEGKAEPRGAEGKCGEGKCGGNDKPKGAEGKCGEGKCGGGR